MSQTQADPSLVCGSNESSQPAAGSRPRRWTSPEGRSWSPELLPRGPSAAYESSVVMAMLDAHHGMLSRVLEAQERHEANMHAQTRLILRSLSGTLRSASSAALVPKPQRAEPGAEGSVDGGLGMASRGVEGSDGDSVGASLQAPPMYPSEDSKQWQASFTDQDGNAWVPPPVGARRSLASPAPSAAGSGSASTVGSRTTPPTEKHDLDETLQRLRQSGKVFFWNNASSDDSKLRTAGCRNGSGVASRIVHNVVFEMIVSVVIVANAGTIGYQADHDMSLIGRSGEEESPHNFLWANRVFALVFFAELILRIVAEGFSFACPSSKNFSWNMFDCFIVASSLVEELALVISSTWRSHISSLRVVRILRLVRAVRVVRILRFFRELRIMVSGIMNCGRSLLWASLLIVVMTYIFAVVFLQITTTWLEDEGFPDSCEDNFLSPCVVKANFRSLTWSMYTLFKSMSGGSSWGEISDPMGTISPLVPYLFCVYIMLAVFVVLNVITAIFVDSAARVSDDEATRVLDNIQRKSVWIRNAKELFHILDARQEGYLEWKDINRLFTDERCQSCLQEFGIDLDFQSTQVLFNLFDVKGEGRIYQDQFAKTLYRLQGTARSLDVSRIHGTVTSMNKAIKDLSKKVDTLGAIMGLTLSASRRKSGTRSGSASPPQLPSLRHQAR